MLKPLFVLEIFTFLPRGFGYVENGLISRLMLIAKIYDVTDWNSNNSKKNTNCPIYIEVKAIRQ